MFSVLITKIKAGHKIYTISGAASFSRVHCGSARAVIETQIHTMLVFEQENNFRQNHSFVQSQKAT